MGVTAVVLYSMGVYLGRNFNIEQKEEICL